MAFAGVVLAGGQSRRMGRDKADLIINNHTLLQNAEHLLQHAGAREILISRNIGNAQDNVITDIYPNNGPLGGIYSTLLQTQHDVLVCAVDMPLLTTGQLAALVSASAKHDKTMNAWQLNNEPLPVFIRNTETVKTHLKSLLTSSNAPKSIKNFLRNIGVVSIACDDYHTLLNTNTPQQFNAAQAIVKQQYSAHNG